MKTIIFLVVSWFAIMGIGLYDSQNPVNCRHSEQLTIGLRYAEYVTCQGGLTGIDLDSEFIRYVD